MRGRQPLLWVGLAVAVSGAAGGAHHSIAGVYDSRQRVTVEGRVAEFRFVDPHPLLMIEVDLAEADAAGTRVQSWTLEMDNRWELSEVGMTGRTFAPGDRVTVTGSLARTQPHRLYVLQLDRQADGFRYEQVGSRPRVRVPGVGVEPTRP